MSDHKLKTLYLFKYDHKTGVITKYDIVDYSVRPSERRGRRFIFRYNSQRYSVYEDELEKVSSRRLYTFNPSFNDAFDSFDAWMDERKKAASKEAKRIAELHNKLRECNRGKLEKKNDRTNRDI